MKRVQQGFTLIELMIVVAIIGILAAVALPQYQDYTKKAKLANAITSMENYKVAVAVCTQETGDVANCDSATNGVPDASKFTATKEVKSISVTDGVIAITLSDAIGANFTNKKITYTPVPQADTIGWQITTDVDSTKEPAAYQAITKNSAAAAGGSASGSSS